MVGHLEFLYAECQVVSPAVGKTVILLHPLLLLVGVSIRMERGCQQNNSLADGYRWPEARTDAVCLLLLLCVCVVLRISVHVCMSACCVFRVVRERARRRVYANARSVVALELCVCVRACVCVCCPPCRHLSAAAPVGRFWAFRFSRALFGRPGEAQTTDLALTSGVCDLDGTWDTNWDHTMQVPPAPTHTHTLF